MEVTAAEIRKLVDRPVTECPVTSVYLNTDGAQLPTTRDYEARLDALLREVRRKGDELGGSRGDAVRRDADAIRAWVRNEFQRGGGDVRGLGLFASEGEIFEIVESAVPVRNTFRVNDRPYVVPLEGLLGRSHHVVLVIIERDKARIFRYQLGRVEEYMAIASDVHRHHEQGAWSQLRYQKNVEHEALHHMKDVSEVLLRLHENHPIDALVVAGPQAEAADFARNHLHPYLQKVLHGEPIALSVNIADNDLKARLRGVEQELVSSRRAELLQRLAAAQGQAEKAARGIRHVLEAINGKAVEVLFVVEGAGIPGFRSATGALALHEDEAKAYGEPVVPVADLLDEVIDEAVRSGAAIELFRDEVRLDGHPVAALLRF